MSRRLSICIINPRSQPSYWTWDFGMPFYGLGRKPRYSMANGALVALAALVPPEHEVVILDENVETIDFESLRRFDVIGVTGMVVQAERMCEILRRLRGLSAVVVAGGPFVTLSEATFEGLCDVLFVGEAEETWPAFLGALASGAPTEARYEQAEKTDMTRVSVPRFDLLRPGRYVTAPVQFSRGCPFLCEFCDIITIFGRRPRVKRPEQILAELDAVTAQGFDNCFLVDDNFIGNKVEAKKLLQRVIEWQEARGYPLVFTTEASINLADDRELIDLMVRANILEVFVGIETPRKASLAETRKHQNVHGDSLLAKLARIRAGGITVTGGFIVGFDNDDERIFDEQFDFIQASGIANLSISLLTPLPKTPLYDRLEAEGRLDYGDPELIFHPKQMTREQLKAGFRELLNRVFDVDAYFDRVFDGHAALLASRRSPEATAATVRLTFRQRLRRTAGAAAYAVKFALAGPRDGRLSQHLRACTNGPRRKAAAAARALKLAFEMARRGELSRHLRACPRVLRRNDALGRDAFGFEALVDRWIAYWHFASVTRHLNGTRFGIVRGSDESPSPRGRNGPRRLAEQEAAGGRV
jgi:radical SAM superfamily enzyme YgiQ (UPF0313 family)